MRFDKLLAGAPRILALAAPLALATACAQNGGAGGGVYTGGDAGPTRFTQIGRAQPVTVKVASAPAAAPNVTAPGLSVDQARRRVEAYLAQAGFEPESRAAGDLYTISGERMASAKDADAKRPEAVCALRALERPQMYTTHVDVRLSAAADAGVRMGIEVKVVEVDSNLLSGAFSKQTCQSRGSLEAALRRAALGG